MSRASKSEEFELELPSEVVRTPARSTQHGPTPWILIATILIVLGVVIAEPPPSRWQSGIVPRIHAPEMQWSTPRSVQPGDETRLWLAPERVVVSDERAVTGYHRDTGAEVWRVESTSPACHADRARVMCAGLSRSGTELLEIDAATGTVSRTEVPGLVGVLPLARDLILVRDRGAGSTVSRERPGGEVVWSVSLPGQRLGAEGRLWNRLQASGQYLFLGLYGTHSWYSGVHHLSDGSDAELGFVEITPLTSEQHLWTILDAGGNWRLLASDGTMSEPIPGWSLAVDDDPAGDVSVVPDGQRLRATSREDAQTLWVVEFEGYPIARAGGVVVADTHQDVGLAGFDARTGSELWRSSVRGYPWALLSDGASMVVITDMSVVASLDLRSGTSTRIEGTEGHGFLVSVKHDDTDLVILTERALTLISLN